MRDNFGELFDIGRFQVDHLVSLIMVLKVPQVDAKVVWGKEVLTVRTHTQRVDVVIVTIFELLSFHALNARAYYLSFGHHDLVVSIYWTFWVLSLHAVLELPQLNDSIIGWEELKGASFRSVKEL